jgi:hypothetical protein
MDFEGYVMAEKPCIFDTNKECPARVVTRIANKLDWNLAELASKVCPICPIRLAMLPKDAHSS